MSKAPTRTHKLIAEDAIEFVEYGERHARWLSALMTAIANELEGRGSKAIDIVRIETAKELASLGQYLAADCSGYLELHAGNLLRDLEGGEA